jgi:5-methylcytosine-specific restriction endonuclease McrA
MPLKDKKERSAYNKTYREANREKALAYGTAYREANREETRENNKEYGKKYRDANREKEAIRHRMYRKVNPESDAEYYQVNSGKIIARVKAYNKVNPEIVTAIKHKRRARKTQAGGYFTANEWHTLCFAVGHKCLCCKEQKKLVPDHVIPIALGGTSWLWNIQPLCQPCNSKKGVKTTDYRYQD